MTNKLLNDILGTALPTDPSVALWTWLKSVWTTSTGYTVPAVAAIKFDTKFGEFKGFFNFIVVENMPKKITPQTLGAFRFSTTEVKRLQIMCIGTSAKDTKWKIEQHIQSLINGNVTDMRATYGISEIHVSDFNEITTSETEATITGVQPNLGFQKARSYCTVNMKYDQYQSS